MDYVKLFQTAYKVGAKAGDSGYLQADKKDLIRIYGEDGYNEIVQAVKRGMPANKAMEILNQRMAAQRQQVQVEEAPPVMGSSKWATWQQLMQAGLLHDPDDRLTTPDIYFGAFQNPDPRTREKNQNWLYWSGSSHLMTVAPTGAGKSAIQIIPNMLSYEGSIFVFDPKGELYRATSFYRSQIGKVYRLAPFEEGSNCFNPIDGISSMEDAMELAQVVYPQESSGDGAFYEKEARAFLSALMYLVSFQPENGNMNAVRDFVSKPVEVFLDEVKGIAANENHSAFIRRAFGVVASFKVDIVTTLKRSLLEKMQVWDSEAIQNVTNHSDFSFQELKTGVTTIYLTVPFHRIEAYSYYVKAMMTMALEAMVAVPERPKIPVLFLLDEFLSLGYFHRFVTALRTHRDAGVRLWYFLQGITDLEETYPQSWRSFFTATEGKCFFGVRDHFTGELIANLLGNQTLAYTTTSTNTNVSHNPGSMGGFEGASTSSTHGTTTTTNLTGRPLMTAQEVQQFLGTSDPNGTRLGILSLPGQSPIPTVSPPWYLGYSHLTRFGCRENEANRSPTMTALWHHLNRDFFADQLRPPLAIEYQDFSMGRDGYAPFNPGLRAMHDSEHDRILFVKACRQIEEKYLEVAPIQTPEAQAMADIAYQFMFRALLHEMIHQATMQLGNAPRDDHGAVFARYAQEVYERSLNLEEFNFLPPSQATLYQWPIMVPMDTVLSAMTAYDGIPSAG